MSKFKVDHSNFSNETLARMNEQHKFLAKAFLSIQEQLEASLPEVEKRTEEDDDRITSHKYAFLAATILNLIANNDLCVDCFLDTFDQATDSVIKEGFLKFHREIAEEHPDLSSFSPTGKAN